MKIRFKNDVKTSGNSTLGALNAGDVFVLYVSDYDGRFPDLWMKVKMDKDENDTEEAAVRLKDGLVAYGKPDMYVIQYHGALTVDRLKF